MTHRELMEWRYLETIEPFDAERNEYYLAQLSSLFYSAWSGEKAKKLNMTDFLLFREKDEPKKQTAEDQVAIGEAMASTGLLKKG